MSDENQTWLSMLKVQISHRCCVLSKGLLLQIEIKEALRPFNYLEWSTAAATFSDLSPTGPLALEIQNIFQPFRAHGGITWYQVHILHQSLRQSFHEVPAASLPPLSARVIGLSSLLPAAGCFSMIQLCVEHLTITEQKPRAMSAAGGEGGDNCLLYDYEQIEEGGRFC